MSAPGRGGDERGRPRRRWRPRRSIATALRMSVWLIPLVVSVAVAMLVAGTLPGAVTIRGQIAWWAVVLGSSVLALVATDRLARRTLPLAALLDVSLAFPHRPPSRFAVLRQLRSIEELRSRIREGDGDGARAAADLLALVVALDEHDRATRGHSERVRLYAELLGEELDLDDEELDRLRWAALLHDIGKLTVPAEVLNKGDALEDDEWTHVRRHPSEGARLVAPLAGWLGPWTGAIEHHHERVDGDGYPHGLEGDQIALGGRIVAVADAFETMTAARPYKRPLTIAAARRELVAAAGAHFDERIVRAFLDLSVPRLRHVAGWSAWVASIPGLWALRRLPRTAGNGVVTAASVGILAASGVLVPSPGPGSAGPMAAGTTAPDVADRASPPGGRLAAPPDGSSDTSDDVADPEREATDRDAPPPAGDDPPDDGDTTDAGTTDPGGTTDGGTTDPDGTTGGDTTGGDTTGGDGDGGDDGGTGGEPPPDGPQDTHQVGHDDAAVLRTLYLHAAPVDTDLRHEILPLDSAEPQRTELINYDVDVDDVPGLRLRPSDRGRDETRREHRQRWAVDLGAPTTLAGNMSLTVWVTAATSGTSAVELEAYVDDCARTFTDCDPVGGGATTSGAASGTWQQITVDLPLGTAFMLDDRLLVLTLVAGPASDGDVSVAFDTTRYPSVLETSVGVIASPALPATAAGAQDGRGLARDR